MWLAVYWALRRIVGRFVGLHCRSHSVDPFFVDLCKRFSMNTLFKKAWKDGWQSSFSATTRSKERDFAKKSFSIKTLRLLQGSSFIGLPPARIFWFCFVLLLSFRLMWLKVRCSQKHSENPLSRSLSFSPMTVALFCCFKMNETFLVTSKPVRSVELANACRTAFFTLSRRFGDAFLYHIFY